MGQIANQMAFELFLKIKEKIKEKRKKRKRKMVQKDTKKFQVIELFKIKKHRKLTVIRIDLKIISAYFYAIMNVIFEFWEKHLWSGLMHLVWLS